MKNIIVFAIGLFFSFSAVAQIDVAAADLGGNPAIELTVSGVDAKFLDKQWSKKTKEFGGKAKKNKKTGETVITEAMMSNINPNPLTVTSGIVASGEDAVLTMMVDMGEAGVVSQEDHNNEFMMLKTMLMDFGVASKKASIEQEKADAEKELQKMQKNLEKLVATKAKLEADIETNKKKITDAEAAIQKNETDQATKKQEIATQSEVVKAVKARLENVVKE